MFKNLIAMLALTLCAMFATAANDAVVDGVRYQAESQKTKTVTLAPGEEEKVGQSCAKTNSGMHIFVSCHWEKTVKADQSGNISVGPGGSTLEEGLRPEIVFSMISIGLMIVALALMYFKLNSFVAIAAVVAFAAFAAAVVAATAIVVAIISAAVVASIAAIVAAIAFIIVAVIATITTDDNRRLFYRAASTHLVLMTVTIVSLW
jgi:lysylphosphatidylglycerol synthetase-like protein (DUF2156 family)